MMSIASHGWRSLPNGKLLRLCVLAFWLTVPTATDLLASGPAFAESSAARTGTESVRAVFDPDQTNQYVLDIEAALARAQAAYGVIPQAAADEITEKADIRFAPRRKIAAENKIVHHRMVALINVWRDSIDEETRQYVHYGTTTVDIYDTALTLQLRRSALILIARLREIEAVLIRMARANQDAIMPGRTLGQHALPITFGKKISTWLAENRRNIERLKHALGELEQSAILKGAVGTYAGLGAHAIEIERSFARELGLRTPYPDDWHGSRDVYANYALTLALISRSFGDIGQELFLLQSTDIGETDEPRAAHAISSSSMAQKINPNKSEDLIQAARVIPRLAEIVLDDVVNFFERDNTSEPNIILKKISVESEKNLSTAYALLDQLEVNRDAMRRNLDRTHGFIMAQRVAFALSATLGKEEADKLVHAMIHDAIKMKIGFRQALLKNPVSSRLLSPNEIDTLLEPEGYLGLAREEIQAVIVRVEALRRTDPPLR
jgi:adenylosuccinate lyase